MLALADNTVCCDKLLERDDIIFCVVVLRRFMAVEDRYMNIFLL